MTKLTKKSYFLSTKSYFCAVKSHFAVIRLNIIPLLNLWFADHLGGRYRHGNIAVKKVTFICKFSHIFHNHYDDTKIMTFVIMMIT